MKTLSTHQIFLLHEQLCAETGGSQGLRDDGLPQSALSAVLRRKWYPSDWPGSGTAQERGIPAPRRPDKIYKDACARNAVEGRDGNLKRRYGLDLIMSKLDETAKTEAALNILDSSHECSPPAASMVVVLFSFRRFALVFQ